MEVSPKEKSSSSANVSRPTTRLLRYPLRSATKLKEERPPLADSSNSSVLRSRHETPQVEIPNAHENSVWDLAWHPIGCILCR